jgi:hypothetical protein
MRAIYYFIFNAEIINNSELFITTDTENGHLIIV